MFNFEKPLELPPQLTWKYLDEPAFMSWTIRARNYSTVIANAGFAVIVLISFAATVITNQGDADSGISQPWRGLMDVMVFLIPVLLAWTGLGQRVNLAYRFAETGWEYCQWKDTPKWHFTMVKWVTGITVVGSIYMATLEPGFIMGALIGPGGMVLLYLSMANSKTYLDLETEYHHVVIEWSAVTQLAIATNREIVDLKYGQMSDMGIRPVIWNVNIFCRRGQKEPVANAIKPYLPPGTPFIRAKLDFLLKTDG